MLDQQRGDEGILERARSSPRIVVAIVAGALLLFAWIAWAIYVTSSNGASAGLGVVIAWPAMLAALALVSLPFIGGYLLVRRLSEDSGETGPQESDSAGESEGEDVEEDEDSDVEEDEDSDEEESEPDSEPKAAKKS